MGMWGFDLYQNDMTLDIKDEFEITLSHFSISSIKEAYKI